jgi:DNA polymerase-3 subunit epsilon
VSAAAHPLRQWLAAWRKQRQLRRLTDPAYSFTLEAPPPDEWVSLDCETTGLDTRRDHIVSIGAVRIQGQRILTSQRLELLVRPPHGVSADSVRIHQLRERDLAQGIPVQDAVLQLLEFIGSRPLVGYYLEFDAAMINRVLRPLLGIALPQPCNEVSELYYDYKFRQLSPHRQQSPNIDLRFATLMQDLGLPQSKAHDAVNDAVMAALAFVKLRQLLGR